MARMAIRSVSCASQSTALRKKFWFSGARKLSTEKSVLPTTTNRPVGPRAVVSLAVSVLTCAATRRVRKLSEGHCRPGLMRTLRPSTPA